jgi:multicomponent Na+:H+ antiporter subunit E
VRRLLTRPVRIAYAIVYFVYELVLANLRLAWDVVTPGLPPAAGIIRVVTDARTAGEVWLVSSAISMTPGTLTLEVEAESRSLYVHTLYAEDREAFERQIGALERVLLAAVR